MLARLNLHTHMHAHLSFFLVDDSKLVAHVHGVLVKLLDPSFSLGDCDSDHLVHVQLLSVHPGNILYTVCVLLYTLNLKFVFFFTQEGGSAKIQKGPGRGEANTNPRG